MRKISKQTVFKKIKPINKRDLPRNEEIVEILRELDDQEKYFMILLTLTGRRSCDILRMVWKNVKMNKKGSFCVVLPFDKVHRNTLVSFEFRLQEWNLEYPIEDFKKWLKIGMNSKSGLVFPGFDNARKQKLSRHCKHFRIHSLRNRLAIQMLINKVPSKMILSKIGWESFSSLKHYTKVSASFLSEFESYDEAVNFLLDEFA